MGLAFLPKIARKCFLPKARPRWVPAIGEEDHGSDCWRSHRPPHPLTRPEQLEVPGNCWNQAEDPERTGVVSSPG